MDVQSSKPKRRPMLRVKNKGGAPKGNRNALKSGYYTRPRLDARRKFHGEVRALILQMNATVARAHLAAMGVKPKVTVTVMSSPHRPSN